VRGVVRNLTARLLRIVRPEAGPMGRRYRGPIPSAALKIMYQALSFISLTLQRTLRPPLMDRHGSSGRESKLDWIASLRSQSLADASRYNPTSYTCVIYVYDACVRIASRKRAFIHLH
jgi:hypothetical protein